MIQLSTAGYLSEEYKNTNSKKNMHPPWSLQHYRQQQRHGNNPSVHRQGNGSGRYGVYIHWNITQPYKNEP